MQAGHQWRTWTHLALAPKAFVNKQGETPRWWLLDQQILS
jgi:hypothetical protein